MKSRAEIQTPEQAAFSEVVDRLEWAVQFLGGEPYKPWDSAEEWLPYARRALLNAIPMTRRTNLRGGAVAARQAHNLKAAGSIPAPAILSVSVTRESVSQPADSTRRSVLPPDSDRARRSAGSEILTHRFLAMLWNGRHEVCQLISLAL